MNPPAWFRHMPTIKSTELTDSVSRYSWYQDTTVMKQSLVGQNDDPDEMTEFVMTEEEMAWARNTMTPDELAEMLSSGLDMNHFLVMMVRTAVSLHTACKAALSFV